MKKNPRTLSALGLAVAAVVALAWASSGCKPKPSSQQGSAPAPTPASPLSAPPAQIAKPHVAAKKRQAENLSAATQVPLPAEVQSLFAAAEAGDWSRALRAFGQFDSSLRGISGANALTSFGQIASETLSGAQQFVGNTARLTELYAREILKAVPTNSIYFGGTDPGRFGVIALSESHADGRPFFTLTQNQLVDGKYLYYVQQMYGAKIAVPSMEDAKANFESYSLDAQKRHAEKQLRPDEEVRVLPGGRTQVSGRGAIIALNAGLLRLFFEKNPERPFYLEESFPLDWTLPHMQPAGPVLELRRSTGSELPADLFARDTAYWQALCQKLIGPAGTAETATSNLCRWAETAYLQRDKSVFAGDPDYWGDEASQKLFAKLRGVQAAAFAWHWNQNHSSGKPALRTAADRAFRQAFALCPFHPDVALGFYSFLVADNRVDEARQIAQTALKFKPSDPDTARQMDRLKALHDGK